MKISRLLSLLFLVSLFFTTISCENEPLEGTFISELDPVAEPGQFVAKIGDELFTAEAITATVFINGTFVITGTNEAGESITLTVTEIASGSFNITAGGTAVNSGVYLNGADLVPYTTNVTLGGAGTVDITLLDDAAQLISGNFQFIGVRPTFDDNGDPVFDDNGNPVVERVEITQGAFEEIEYIADEGTGSITDQCSATLDNVNFDLSELDVSLVEIAMVRIIKVIATDSNGATIRLDIPEALGVGTFDMVTISDGTQLIGLYNPGVGQDTFSSNPGTLTITELDTETGILKGSFQFTATDPVDMDPRVFEIAEGMLDIDYID